MQKRLMKNLPFIAIALLFLSFTSTVAAEEIDSLQPWQGEFHSLYALIQGPEMDALYNDIALAAKAAGKDYTADKVKEVNLKMYSTDFQRVIVGADTVSYFKKEAPNNPIKVQYVIRG